MDAAKRHDTAELYRLYKELRCRGTQGRRDGRKSVVGNIEEELDAWKKHFEAVSKTRGQVSEGAWENIPEAIGTADWLSRPPTDIEMDRSIDKMKVKKAGGIDNMVAEVLKYGGKRLRKQIYSIVKKCGKEQSKQTKAMRRKDGQINGKLASSCHCGRKRAKNLTRTITEESHS